MRAARRAGIPVSLCGEMASNPLAVPILVGLGLGELSGVASAVPVVKEIVRALDLGEVGARTRARALEAGDRRRRCARSPRARLAQAGLLEHPDIGEWLRRVVGENAGVAAELRRRGAAPLRAARRAGAAPPRARALGFERLGDGVARRP